MRQACWQYQNANGYKNISIRGTHRDSVILDGSTCSYFGGKFINLIGSGISITDLTIKLASATDTSSHYAVVDVKSLVSPCNASQTSNIVVENILIDGCWDHGINITESDSVLIQNVEVTNANLINLDGRNEPGGWGSGIKTRLVNHLEISNASVYNCWGEGVANARTTDSYVHHNEIADNYSVNIYLDNVIGGTYSHNLTSATIGDSTYWRSSSPSPGFGIATEHYSSNNFDETSNIKIFNNIILNTQGLYIDDNRSSGEPKGTDFKDIWFCNNTIVGWQGNLSTNLRAIRVDFAGFQNSDFALDSIHIFNNIIAMDSSFVLPNGNGQLISGTPQALPSTLFYGNNYWSANPEKFSFYNYPHNNTDSINGEIPTLAFPNQLDLIEPTGLNYLTFSGITFNFIQDDFYGQSRSNGSQVGAINPNVLMRSDQPKLVNRLLIYPNPAQDFVTIKSSREEIRSIKIYNVLGEIVISKKMINEKNITLDISNLKSNVYYIGVSFENIFQTKKIVISR